MSAWSGKWRNSQQLLKPANVEGLVRIRAIVRMGESRVHACRHDCTFSIVNTKLVEMFLQPEHIRIRFHGPRGDAASLWRGFDLFCGDELQIWQHLRLLIVSHYSVTPTAIAPSSFLNYSAPHKSPARSVSTTCRCYGAFTHTLGWDRMGWSVHCEMMLCLFRVHEYSYV